MSLPLSVLQDRAPPAQIHCAAALGPVWGRHTGEVAEGPPKHPEPQGSPPGLPLTPAQHHCSLSSSMWQHDHKQHSECFINKYNTYALCTKYTKYTKYSMRTVQYKFMFTVWHDKMSLLNSHWTTQVETVKVHETFTSLVRKDYQNVSIFASYSNAR